MTTPALTREQCAAEAQLLADLDFLDQLTTDRLLTTAQREALVARVAGDSVTVIGGFIWRFRLDKHQR